MEELLDYEGLIYSIISKYSKRYERDDLYQVGMIGLIDAYNHFDQSLGTKFSTFAYYYIVGEVNKYIRESSSLKVSKELIDLNKRIINARELMIQKLEREPSNLEIALYLDVDENMIDSALLATGEVESIDATYEEFKSYDNTSCDVLDLREELSKPNDYEKKLIVDRYFNEMTQSEISKKLGISQVQVSRNETKILQKLKTKLCA